MRSYGQGRNAASIPRWRRKWLIILLITPHSGHTASRTRSTVGFSMRQADLGSTAFLWLTLANLAPGAAAAGDKAPADCTTTGGAWKAMLESEYAFGQKARTSVAGAFLEYLGADSWVLNPGPVPAARFIRRPNRQQHAGVVSDHRRTCTGRGSRFHRRTLGLHVYRQR